MVHIAFDLPEEILAGFHQDPPTFTRELRLAAAVKWYETKRVSQGRAAEIAGVSRAELIEALGRYDVSPFQQTAEEILSDAGEGFVSRTRPEPDDVAPEREQRPVAERLRRLEALLDSVPPAPGLPLSAFDRDEIYR